MKQTVIKLFTLWLLLVAPHTVIAHDETRQRITVAAYEFPPYYSSRVNAHMLGVLIRTLNSSQTNFEFVVQEVRPHDRYRALSAEGCCDLLFFESPEWGWDKHPNVRLGPSLSRGTERLYAKSERLEAGEIAFRVDGKAKVGGVLGYHYRFADFSTERETLELDFNVYSTDSQISLLNMLANERLDLAVLTDEFVRWLQLREHAEALLLSPNTEVDHIYTTKLLMSSKMDEEFEAISALLNELHASGRIADIFNDFGILSSYEFEPVSR